MGFGSLLNGGVYQLDLLLLIVDLHGVFVQFAFQLSRLPHKLLVVVRLALPWVRLGDVAAKCRAVSKLLLANFALKF